MDEKSKEWQRQIGIIVSLTVLISSVCFIAALQFDCILIDPKRPHAMSNYAIVLCGFIGVVGGQFSWLANFGLPLSWLMMRWQDGRESCVWFAIGSLAIALSFLFGIGDPIMTPEGGGVQKQVVGVGLGYWLWIASFVVTALGAAIVAKMESMADDDKEPPLSRKADASVDGV